MSSNLSEILNETIEQHWTEFTARYNDDVAHRARRRQNTPAKKDIVELTRLGLLDAMPARFGYDDAKAILSAATQAGSTRTEGGFTIDGDGETWTIKTPASKLYQYLNSVREARCEELLAKYNLPWWVGL
jgi:hypothetical protein